MSSMVRPSMWGTVSLTRQRRAKGPSIASITTASTSQAKTRRGSVAGAQISATAWKATRTPEAVRRWTDHPRARAPADARASAAGVTFAPVHLAVDDLVRHLHVALLRLRRLLLRGGVRLVVELDADREVVRPHVGQPAHI